MTLEGAMIAAGFDPPDHIEPGRVVRFSTNGKSSDRSGWVHLFPDALGAIFGDWRTGANHTWQAERDKPLNEHEQAEFRRSTGAAKKAAFQAREAGYTEAARQAKVEWEAAPPAPESHPYLTRKHVGPEGLRLCVHGRYAGWLIAGVVGPDGDLQSLQYIGGDGSKRFMSGGRMRGGHMWLGRPDDGAEVLLLCEGLATGASLHEATGLPVYVCFSAGNLSPVAQMVRKQYPKARLLVCGDDDIQTLANSGRTKAEQAAEAVAAGVVFPPGAGDFNDMAQAQGLDAVRAHIEKALGAMTPIPSTFAAPALPGTDARDGTASTRPLSELGNALRLLDAHGDNIRYVWESKAWLLWRDGAWSWDPDGAAVRGLTARLPAQIYQEGGLHLEDAEFFAKWSRTSQKERTIQATVSLLEDFERVRLPLAMVDVDPLLVGLDHCRQVVDLKTGATRPARQSDFITKALNADRLGEPAKAVRWREFLRQVFGDDPELIDWLKRWCGYLLTGCTTEQIFVFCFGLGANGKSVLAETLRHVMGDYARAIAAETLTESRRQAGSATPDLAALIGARLAMSSETEDGAALAESLIKSLVAGDTMSVRQLYAGPVQFSPQFKLMMLGNHKPVIRGNDYGIWRRVRLLPFRRTFSEKERDPQLLDKLKAEAPHILAWMAEGAVAWQRRGLADVPATIRQATGDYQEEQDLVGRWLSECCRLSPASETSSTDLYANYKAWAMDNGLKPASSISLGRRLGERGYTSRKSHGKMVWAGLATNDASYSEAYRTASGR